MSKAEQRRRSRRSYANPKRVSKDKAFHEKTVLGETILSKKTKTGCLRGKNGTGVPITLRRV